ncbi:error-prone DNA polymerase [Streptomyces sp. 4N509B]|uniref:error-prone DNA polymerase n=1 Tax=Streptomyces sp. 4N509B TaxID=3457413 RepID=UPI003FD1BD5B
MGFDNPPIPWRTFERRLSWRTGPDADTGAETDAGGEAEREHPRPAPRPARRPTPRPPRPGGAPFPWAELHCHSAYSFLDGASDPEALVAEAVRLGVETIGVTDHDGLYGAARLAQAARDAKELHGADIGTVFGAELGLGPAPTGGSGTSRQQQRPQQRRRTGVPDPRDDHLLVLARDPEGYAALAGAITAAQLRGGKGNPLYDLAELAASPGSRGGHWAVLTGCRKGRVRAALAADGPRAAEAELRRLVDAFGRDHVHVELIDHRQPLDDAHNDALATLARRVGVGVVASNNVHHARPADAHLAQVLAAVRARRGLEDMVGWLPVAGTAYLRSGAEMAARLARYPGVREATAELGRACAFDLRLVAPELPPRRLGEGHTDASWLRHEVERGAEERYGPRGPATAHVYAQLDHELGVIERLGFPGYFLIVHEIVEFCRAKGILAQGRGSAANSAVCYALGITAVDPVRHRLLFERFLSDAREGPPDIDIDIANNRREEVIQHVYDTYGRDRAAMVANVNTYRPKMAIRDAARALGHSPGQADAWTRRVEHRLGPDVGPRGEKTPARPLPAGSPPGRREPREDELLPEPLAGVVQRMLRLPRHLSIHSGGMVLADRPVGEVCPVEWATMPGRSVLQWDKDDCAFAGLVKFDLLGLGMLAALSDAFDLLRAHHDLDLGLHTVPAEDPAVYDMLCDADSVGVFQVESRAQMSTLPRLRPRRFYDLVIEVALIRPGPIQGGSVHPYLRRASGREPVTYPHRLMRPALERTLGVPLFQEQMMQLAIDCAGFTPKDADELRQAMSSKRSPERIERLRDRLMSGMAAHAIPPDVAEDIYAKLFGFASYGFPESHAYSFAHLVYASAWLKRHHPAAFTAALLNNQPMGFYAPQSLIADARRHGVRTLGVDVNASAAHATLEGPPLPVTSDHPHAPTATPQPAIRMGLATVRTVGADLARAIAAGRPYDDLDDLVHRVHIPRPALEALATAGAFGCFGLDRRAAQWAAAALAGTTPDHLPGTTPGTAAPSPAPSAAPSPAPAPVPAMTPPEQTLADLWSTGSSPDSHPVQHVRPHLDALGAVPAGRLPHTPPGGPVLVGGLVTHRQRPPTAHGVVFMTIEDETGMINAICPPTTWDRHRATALDSSALLLAGTVERQDGATNLLVHDMAPLDVSGSIPSRNFH